VWFQLVEKDTGRAFEGSSVASIRRAHDTEDVDDLRWQIQAAFDGNKPAGRDSLAHVAPRRLDIYADRAAFDGGQPVQPSTPVSNLGQYPFRALLVSVPVRLCKRQKTTVTRASTRPALSTSTLPRVDGHPLPTWKLDAATVSGFGVHRQDEDLVLFRREDVAKLFAFLRDDVVRDGRCGYVLGPPGSGKSATAAAFALTLARTDGWVVTWIGLSRMFPSGFVRLDGNAKQTASEYDLTADKIYHNLKGVDDAKQHIVFLDGVTADDRHKVAPCVYWLKENRASRRLVVVTSMAARGKVDDVGELDLGFRDHFVSSWTLKEYLDAVQDDELFENVRAQLDSSDDVEPDETRLIPTWRQTLVRSKYYFAGGNARYMFDRSTAQVVDSPRQAVDTLSNIAQSAAGVVGDRSDSAINRLFCRFGNGKSGVVSRYAGSAMAMVGGPSLIRNVASVLQNDSNPAMDGWILEMYFFARLHKGGVTLYEGENTISWPEDSILVVDPENLPALPRSGWLKPHKFNQGGYDAVYIDVEHKLLRFVQVTRANTHTLHIGYFSSFLTSLQASASSFEIATLEIFFVVERKALPEFTFSTVTGEGLLAAFPGWQKNEECKHVRLVGIDGVASWNDFDW
jgi:hypothetical protein